MATSPAFPTIDEVRAAQAALWSLRLPNGGDLGHYQLNAQGLPGCRGRHYRMRRPGVGSAPLPGLCHDFLATESGDLRGLARGNKTLPTLAELGQFSELDGHAQVLRTYWKFGGMLHPRDDMLLVFYAAAQRVFAERQAGKNTAKAQRAAAAKAQAATKAWLRADDDEPLVI